MLTCECYLERHSRFKNFALQINFHTQAHVTGIVGSSGAGKSTLLKAIAGLITPQQGRIAWGDAVFFDHTARINVPSHQRRVGLVFQDGQLFPHLNVKQNLLYGYQRIPAQQRRFELSEIAALLELTPLLHQHVQQLSGGEAQRVALGRALLYSPQLLLLDEPLSALDGRLKAHILPFLRDIRDHADIPMLYVTHQPQELKDLDAQILYMENGQLICQ